MLILPQRSGTLLRGGSRLVGKSFLKFYVELYAYAPFFDVGQVAVCEASHVIDT